MNNFKRISLVKIKLLDYEFPCFVFLFMFHLLFPPDHISLRLPNLTQGDKITLTGHSSTGGDIKRNEDISNSTVHLTSCTPNQAHQQP
jgi:hypothetical protein